MSSELVVLVTTPEGGLSKRIAEALVGERLAACVNIVTGVESVYRWEGALTTGREQLLIIKTTESRLAALEKRIKELHEYSVPEILALKVEAGSEDYLRWINEMTAGPEAPDLDRAEKV